MQFPLFIVFLMFKMLNRHFHLFLLSFSFHLFLLCTLLAGFGSRLPTSVCWRDQPLAVTTLKYYQKICETSCSDLKVV